MKKKQQKRPQISQKNWRDFPDGGHRPTLAPSPPPLAGAHESEWLCLNYYAILQTDVMTESGYLVIHLCTLISQYIVLYCVS